MSNEQLLREAFEARMTDNGKWPNAITKGRNGCYLLAQTENAWAEWQACAEALATTGPDMPLSMNQFGRLVELTREHLSDNTFVYKATSKTGDTCHFGVESAAKAWAKGGAVEAIKVREFKLHTSVPTDDHLPDAGKKVETAEPGCERYSVQHEVTQGGHRLFTVTDSKTQCSEDVFPDDNPVLYGLLTELQARAALPSKSAVNQQLTTEPSVWEELPSYLIDHCEGVVITEELLQQAVADLLKQRQAKSTTQEQELPPTVGVSIHAGSESISAAAAPTVKAQEPTMLNGLTEAETEQSASVAGLKIQAQEPAACDGGTCGIGGYCNECPQAQAQELPDERAAFEALAKQHGFSERQIKSWDGEDYTDLNTHIAFRWFRIALSAKPVPEGWKLVPIEPTAEMIDAGNRARVYREHGDLDEPDVLSARTYNTKHAWAAMLYVAIAAQGGEG